MKLNTYRFNILDVLIFFLIFAIFLGFVFNKKNTEIKTLFEKSVEANIVVDINDRNIDADTFKHGDRIYVKESGEFLGTITDSVNLKNKIYFPQDGSLVYEYGSDNIGVRLTIDTKMKTNDNGKYIKGGELVTIGKSISLCTDDIDISDAVIYDITT